MKGAGGGQSGLGGASRFRLLTVMRFERVAYEVFGGVNCAPTLSYMQDDVLWDHVGILNP